MSTLQRRLVSVEFRCAVSYHVCMGRGWVCNPAARTWPPLVSQFWGVIIGTSCTNVHLVTVDHSNIWLPGPRSTLWHRSAAGCAGGLELASSQVPFPTPMILMPYLTSLGMSCFSFRHFKLGAPRGQFQVGGIGAATIRHQRPDFLNRVSCHLHHTPRQGDPFGLTTGEDLIPGRGGLLLATSRPCVHRGSPIQAL